MARNLRREKQGDKFQKATKYGKTSTRGNTHYHVKRGKSQAVAIGTEGGQVIYERGMTFTSFNKTKRNHGSEGRRHDRRPKKKKEVRGLEVMGFMNNREGGGKGGEKGGNAKLS